MSKKRKRRLRKLAKVLGAGLAIAGLGKALANRKRDASIATNEAKEAGFDIPLVKSTPEENTFKVQDVSTPVKTKTTIMDSMPPRPKYNEKSIRVKDGKVFTIKGAKEGKPPKMAGIDTPGIYVRDDGRITAGGKQYLNKEHYASRNEKPAMLGTNYYKAPRVQSDMEQYIMENPLAVSARKGGRIVKGKKTAVRTGAAKRGFGRAFKGGKR